MTKIKELITDEVAHVFAEIYRDTVSWRVRRSGRGEPYCWFVDGRLDEYGIATLDLGRGFLKDRAFHEPHRFGIDVTDDRVYEMLDRAKKILMVEVKLGNEWRI